ncbi:TPA: hypothetical protein NI617_002000 [Pseudomonas aeruginosa]|nr:hypothetical protein [Pseudomonas aeruginosa]MCO3715500.1 hypothetical protein [Pseudomonas aeruginosa]HCF7538149.1 hypothetical protein [Pseudomonas aeruginosa]HCF9363216.1 hypothetical protein [Pseudomonas aeruginosa]HCF9369493.1 hypothetical protein [Pseudomonas aeruginosa]
MSAVRSILWAFWSYGVSLPMHLLRAALSGALSFFYPRGFIPCNELADPFAEECATRPVGQSVRLPWVDSSASQILAMNSTGRLLSYIAIASGWFGVAVKEGTSRSITKRSYRYYYRRSLTGNWFAEIWSVPKSGVIAAILALPFIDMARAVMKGQEHGHEGLLLLAPGLLLVTCFLPRALLGRGTHFAAIAPINCSGLGGYGFAHIINMAAALGGLSFLWVAFSAGWSASASASYAAGFLSGQVQMFAHEAAVNGVLMTVATTPVWVALGCLFGMVWTVLPAAAFWVVSLRFMAARSAKTRLESLPFNSIQAAMYRGSDFERAAELVAPQVTLGYLVYICLTVGIILYPIQVWVRSLF